MGKVFESTSDLDPVAYKEAMDVFRHLGNPFRNHFANLSNSTNLGWY
jgi:hypothetical protein